MRRVRLLTVPALVVGVALAIAACGDDDSPEQPIVTATEGTEELSKEAFIEEADAICEESNTAIAQFAASGQGVSQAGEIADLRQGVLDQLQELGPPDEDRRALDDFLTGLENQVEAGEKISLAVQRGADASIPEFEAELDAAQADAATAATEYGFRECGTEPTGADATGTPSAPAAPAVPVAPAPVAPAPAPPSGGAGDTGGGGGGGGGTGGTGGGVAPPG